MVTLGLDFDCHQKLSTSIPWLTMQLLIDKHRSVKAMKIKMLIIIFVYFSLNVTKYGILIDIVDIDRSNDLCCYGYNFGGREIMISIVTKNVCIYKLGWCSINTLEC